MAQEETNSQTSTQDQASLKSEEAQASETQQGPPKATGQQPSAVTGPAADDSLAEFSRMLSVFTHCGRLKATAQLLRPSNQHSSSILSSIEFDRDSEVRNRVLQLLYHLQLVLLMCAADVQYIVLQHQIPTYEPMSSISPCFCDRALGKLFLQACVRAPAFILMFH